MWDGLLWCFGVAALRWGDLELHADGSRGLHLVRSKTDQTAEGKILYLGFG